MTNKELTKEWFERVWNRGEEAAIHELMCEHCNIIGLETPSKGPNGFLFMHQTFFALFSNIKINITQMAEENNLILGHANFKSTHKASGNSIDIFFSFSAKWADGKIVESQNIVDYVGLFTQMGALEGDLIANTLKTEP